MSRTFKILLTSILWNSLSPSPHSYFFRLRTSTNNPFCDRTRVSRCRPSPLHRHRPRPRPSASIASLSAHCVLRPAPETQTNHTAANRSSLGIRCPVTSQLRPRSTLLPTLAAPASHASPPPLRPCLLAFTARNRVRNAGPAEKTAQPTGKKKNKGDITSTSRPANFGWISPVGTSHHARHKSRGAERKATRTRLGAATTSDFSFYIEKSSG